MRVVRMGGDLQRAGAVQITRTDPGELPPGSPSPPRRPGRLEEGLAIRAFLALAPRLGRRQDSQPPEHLAPFETLQIKRAARPGSLSATWYPARTEVPRGAVLLCHPWLQWGRAYFHRRGRLDALRQAGYGVLTFDFGGFGASHRTRVFFDRDVEDALDYLRALAPGLPLHVWGVSSGGKWAHILLSRADGVSGAFFEDIPAHIFEWSWRMAPRWKPAYRCFRAAFRRAYRFLDLRNHAPHLRVLAAAYASGAQDPGIPCEDTHRLAWLAASGGCRARSEVIPDADHLEIAKRAPQTVFELALSTFARAEELGNVVRAPQRAPTRQALSS